MFTPSKKSSFTISLLTLWIIKYIKRDARSCKKTREKLHDQIDLKMEGSQGGDAASQLSQHTIASDHTVNISKTSLIVKGRKYGMQAEIGLFVQKKFYSGT